MTTTQPLTSSLTVNGNGNSNNDTNSIHKTTTFYVSVTGIKIRSWRHLPQFAWHARQSMTQALQAPGNVHVGGGYCQGVHHTISVWKNKAAMVRYVHSGYHKEAIQIAQQVGSFVKVCGYHVTTTNVDFVPPTMREARKNWEEQGRVVFGREHEDGNGSTPGTVTDGRNRVMDPTHENHGPLQADRLTPFTYSMAALCLMSVVILLKPSPLFLQPQLAV